MNAPQIKENKTPSLGEIVGSVTFLIGLLPAWLYVTGWTYAYHYFDRFGIQLMMVEIPKEAYFVYGGIVTQQFSIWILMIAVFGVLAIVLWRRFGVKSRWFGATENLPKAAAGFFTFVVLAVVF